MGILGPCANWCVPLQATACHHIAATRVLLSSDQITRVYWPYTMTDPYSQFHSLGCSSLLFLNSAFHVQPKSLMLPSSSWKRAVWNAVQNDWTDQNPYSWRKVTIHLISFVREFLCPLDSIFALSSWLLSASWLLFRWLLCVPCGWCT